MARQRRWAAFVLEKARLQSPEGEALWLDKRTAALLAWLAWEGPTDRAVLGGTLWPDSQEQTARANLRQLLSRLHKLAGRAVVVTRGPLRLCDDVEVDLSLLRKSVERGPPPRPRRSPAILPGVDLSGIPELEAWVGATTESLRKLVWDGFVARADALVAKGDLPGAIDAIESSLVIDPLSERAHRRLIELHLELGDRAAALRSYQACERLLWEELGVAPMLETTELVATLTAGSPPLPPQLLHPPRFVGRKSELERIRALLAARRIVFLRGPSGIGKTRLIREAIRGWGGIALSFDGRPAEMHIPYAAHLRFVRTVFDALPDLELAPSVRQAIDNIFPDDGAEAASHPEAFAKLFFSEANVAFVRAMAKQDAIAVVDDMQFHDRETLRLEAYLLSSRIEADYSMGSIFSLREDFPAELLRTAERVVAAGAAEVIDLFPLRPEEAAELVASLGLPDEVDAPAALEEAGGNPGALLKSLARRFREEA